jgi:hypothetical protein
MDELVIRFGAWEGPRSPSEDDIRKALEDIESGVCKRPEFTIENVSNWKQEVWNGKQVVRCVMEGRYTTAATFYEETNPIPLGWLIRYHDEDDSRFALTMPTVKGSEFLEGICCGGPLTIRTSCLVPLAMALEALAYFARYQARSPHQAWLAESECYRLT